MSCNRIKCLIAEVCVKFKVKDLLADTWCCEVQATSHEEKAKGWTRWQEHCSRIHMSQLWEKVPFFLFFFPAAIFSVSYNYNCWMLWGIILYSKSRYTALDALRLVSLVDEYFHCEVCNGELVAESEKLAAQEMGDGDENARRRRRDKLEDMLKKLEVSLLASCACWWCDLVVLVMHFWNWRTNLMPLDRV